LAFLAIGVVPAYADRYVVPVPSGVDTPISSVPYTVTSSGHYYLTRTLNQLNNGNSGIEVYGSNHHAAQCRGGEQRETWPLCR
jgi:hypothetical protein